MNIVSIITFVVVGLYTGARGVQYAMIQQVDVKNSVHIVEPVPSYWYLGDTIKVTTFMIEEKNGVRFKSDTLVISSTRNKQDHKTKGQ